MVPNEPGSPQAYLRGYEAAMGKAERQTCSQEGQKPSSNECRCQEEVVGVDEGEVGNEEKVESIVPRRVRARSDTLDSLVGYIVCGCWEPNRKFRLTRFSLSSR